MRLTILLKHTSLLSCARLVNQISGATASASDSTKYIAALGLPIYSQPLLQYLFLYLITIYI